MHISVSFAFSSSVASSRFSLLHALRMQMTPVGHKSFSSVLVERSEGSGGEGEACERARRKGGGGRSGGGTRRDR